MRNRNSDTERLGDLYRDTHVDVLAFLLRRCPTAEDAADCLAETYLVAWEKRNQVPTGSDARPWLFGVARNVMRRGRERQGHLAAAAQSLASQLQDAATARPAHPDNESDRATGALSQLSELDQEIITMNSWDGLTPREIAQILGMSPNIVRVRAHRARAKLRSLLTTNVEPEPDRTSVSDTPGDAMAVQNNGR